MSNHAVVNITDYKNLDPRARHYYGNIKILPDDIVNENMVELVNFDSIHSDELYHYLTENQFYNIYGCDYKDCKYHPKMKYFKFLHYDNVKLAAFEYIFRNNISCTKIYFLYDGKFIESLAAEK